MEAMRDCNKNKKKDNTKYKDKITRKLYKYKLHFRMSKDDSVKA